MRMARTKKQKSDFVLPDSLPERKETVLYVRLAPKDKAAIRAAATAAGYLSMSEYVLQVLRRVAVRRQ